MFLYSTFNTATKPVGDFWPFLRRKIMAHNCELNVLKYPIHMDLYVLIYINIHNQQFSNWLKFNKSKLIFW